MYYMAVLQGAIINLGNLKVLSLWYLGTAWEDTLPEREIVALNYSTKFSTAVYTTFEKTIARDGGSNLHHRVDFFNKNKYKIQSKIFENCEHRIPTEGSSLGLEFIKKNLY